MKKTIIIAAGGTGGHFFPAEALALALQQRGYHLVLMTDSRAGHRSSGPFADQPQYILRGRGVAGKTPWTKLRNFYELFKGVQEARRLLRQLRPAAIICFGGYPSIPPAIGNLNIFGRSRAKLILHEGNALLGKANRFLARRASVIATSFPKLEGTVPPRPVIYTGMPVRPEIEALYTRHYTDARAHINLLVWGGSLGAQVFSEVVPNALSRLPQEVRHRLHVTQQTKEGDISKVQEVYETAGIECTLAPFFEDVAGLLGRSHLVIGRAGGSSVAELTMAGCPAILIPLPIAASDEQSANARKLEEGGAGWCINQSELTAAHLSGKVEALLTNTDQLAEASSAAHRLAIPASAERLAEVVASQIGDASQH